MTNHYDQRPGMFQTPRAACLYFLVLATVSWGAVFLAAWLLYLMVT